MENVAWGQIFVAGWPVLSVLLVFSIVTLAVILERWRTYARITLGADAFMNSVRTANDQQKVIAWCEKSDQPLADITQTVFKTSGNRDDKERMLHRTIQRIVQQLDRGISLLGTVASVAPFVGLLGTVIGIIRAFRAVSTTSSGGASAVALGIAESLVGTAGGLVVAIPALLAYNYFVNRLRRLTQEWELAGAELIDLSLRR